MLILISPFWKFMGDVALEEKSPKCAFHIASWCHLSGCVKEDSWELYLFLNRGLPEACFPG